MERNYDCGCTYVVDHFSNDILIDHEAKLWPLLVLLMYRWTVFWDFLNFCVPSNTFLQKLTQALKRVHPKISCRRGDFFAKNVMAVTLGVLHLRKVYNQKPCPSQTLPGKKQVQNPALFQTHSLTNTCKNHLETTHIASAWGPLPAS